MRTSLYDQGWRQGSIFSAQLPLDAIVLDAQSDGPIRRQKEHGDWVVASQDCDLASTDQIYAEASVELRPVFNANPPDDWGIRSSKLRLTESKYVISSSPRPMVSAEVLTQLCTLGCEIHQMDEARRIAFKTWLGLRYDRPAVPERFVSLAKSISELVSKKRNHIIGRTLRDVLMQFDESAVPTQFSLFAILVDSKDEKVVREWLSEVSLAVSKDLGIANTIEAATTERVSLKLIETSYSANVSQLTWRSSSSDPDGAI